MATQPENANAACEPVLVREGLAIYDAGRGVPLLLMPYPHGFTYTPMADGALARSLIGAGRRVITFDPPGAYRSTRPAGVDMQEMLDCAEEALQACEVPGRVDVVGHSMSSLCALALALARPERTGRLVLIGALSGYGALRRWGMPHNWRPWRHLAFWQFAWYDFLLRQGRGSLADHKRLSRLKDDPSYVNKRLVPAEPVLSDDHLRPAPVRDRWLATSVNYDYAARLADISAPALICAGRYDPQTPLAAARQLEAGLPTSRLVIFEQSGHSPFIEEPERFAQVVGAFLSEGAAVPAL